MKQNKYDAKNHTGKFRNKITIEHFVEETNENGYPVEDWKSFKSLWAQIKTVKGSEIVTSGTEINADTYRFIVRYTDGITPKMRVKFKNRTFDIQSVLNDDEEMRTITIVAIARDRGGE